jgi:putative FmdB family regulatory protein
MPLYEYRCRDCDDTFELRRPMAAANDPAACPDGHTNTVRLLSVFASVGAASTSASEAGTAWSGGERPSVPCSAHCACHGTG